MKHYVVLDTNVLVSALLSRCDDSATVQLLERMMERKFIPVYSEAIIQEYWGVLNRKKFGFSQEKIRWLLEAIIKYGLLVEPTSTGVQLPDFKDLPFYEVTMQKRQDDAYLVTGNLKHFPECTYIVTARQMLNILDQTDIVYS